MNVLIYIQGKGSSVRAKLLKYFLHA